VSGMSGGDSAIVGSSGQVVWLDGVITLTLTFHGGSTAYPSPSADMRAASTTETVVTVATIEGTVSKMQNSNPCSGVDKYIGARTGRPLEKACHTPILLHGRSACVLPV
jgi:hypothetical protein